MLESHQPVVRCIVCVESEIAEIEESEDFQLSSSLFSGATKVQRVVRLKLRFLKSLLAQLQMFLEGVY